MLCPVARSSPSSSTDLLCGRTRSKASREGDYTSVMTDQVARTDPALVTTTVAGAGASGAPPSGPQPRLRDRLARLGTPKAPVNIALEPILQSLREHHPKADVSLLQRAFEVAERQHQGQTRKSGDDYITHPLSVTQILADLGMTPPTLAAALLHDTVEDTAYGLDELRRDFGDEVAQLVDGVTKLDKVTWGEAAKAETVRKMVVAMARDIRVLVIKLADRLHNARTWKHVSRESAESKAQETLEIYAPLAHRLGMNTIKWELEDLAFQALYPKMYDEIVEPRGGAGAGAGGVPRPGPGGGVRGSQGGRDQGDGDGATEALLLGLPEDDRPRSRLRGDLRPGRRAGPRRDGSRLLRRARARCTPGGTRCPAGSRTTSRCRSSTCTSRCTRRSSGRRASRSRSRSAPTRCTGGPNTASRPTTSTRKSTNAAAASPSRVRLAGQRHGLVAPLLDWQRDTADPGEFLDSLRFEIGGGEVYVFTPKGAVVALPVGSTPVDFAYAVHTEVGHHCIGGRVNGRLAPLDSVLENGDTSRSSPPRPTARDRRATGWPSSRALARATRSASGSPRSGVRRRSSRARTRSPSTCASKVTPCTG
jgi:guanosine-3',5'-bis(diphosphate) 3'-pyrophosphohydrolase